jgi:hypothetical protein
MVSLQAAAKVGGRLLKVVKTSFENEGKRTIEK